MSAAATTQGCVVFEDSFVDRLRPISLARPACAVTCGALSLGQLLDELPIPKFFHVRPHLRSILERDGAQLLQASTGPMLYVNGALIPDLKILARLKELLEAGKPFLALNDQRVTAAWCPTPPPEDIGARGTADLVSFILDQRLPVIEDEFPTLEHTCDIMRHHESLLVDHLNYLAVRGNYEERDPGVFVGPNTKIASNVFFDASDGPILIGEGVRIQPFSYVAGPVKIGDRALITDHAAIKHGTVLGHTVKCGGELEATIIEPYSNKQHHGFLGHSYVGSWVNLGAGTSNSDLKNTYGEIKIEANGRPVMTGLQFLGCVVGDFTKTAINTSIFTGMQIGVASFLYGLISTNVPSFTNYARSFGQIKEVGVDIAIKTQMRVAKRRNVTMSPDDITLMNQLFELTRSERQLSSEQLDL